MSARFRLPAGRSYNVRATELERDRQHTQVVCSVLLLDNTVQAFKVSVSTALSVLCFTLRFIERIGQAKSVRQNPINELSASNTLPLCIHCHDHLVVLSHV